MPFDALTMRAVEARWQQDLVGLTCVRMAIGRDRLLLTLKASDGPVNLLIVLQPGIQRLHRTSRANLADKRPLSPWLQKIVPFRIRNLSVPPFERIMRLSIEHGGDWGEPVAATLVVELAGHLTNLILLDRDDRVIDAWRKIAPGRPGRTVWPKLNYQSPPAPPNPTATHRIADLPPWAKTWLAEGGTFEQLQRDWQDGFPGSAWVLSNRDAEDVWVYPVAGYQATPVDDLERALDAVYSRREHKRQEEQLKSQLINQVQSRITHLGEKIGQYRQDRMEDGEKWKNLGDLWLTYQYAFKTDHALKELAVGGFDGRPVTLALEEGKTPADQAADAYRRYKKIKARQAALERLIPVLEAERHELQDLIQDAQDPHPLDWYRDQLKTAGSRTESVDRSPFRHFKSLHGLDIWVGRNRDENAKLTFQKARPDDIWFHAKQAPGSHVVLGSGKTNPDLEDLLDAAELAVFFSSAQASSNVPVDYTRRKFVRKRPHAEPGQVLYQREKTLYMTPDLDRLRRLGAVREKLIGD